MSSPLRVLVVDDEPLARRRVEDLIARASGVEVVGTAATGPQAIAALEKHQAEGEPIDIVFLDVRMPGMSGLDVIHEFGVDAMPETVFVTAYDQHAIAAFDAAAADYLLKPYDDERFAQALKRACRAVRLRQVEGRQRPTSAEAPTYLERFPVDVRGQTAFVPVLDVAYISASGPYAELHARDDVYVIRETMQEIEDALDPALFARIHRSTIVQLGHVEAMMTAAGGSYSVRLRDGTVLSVSRSRRHDVLERLSAAPTRASKSGA